MIDQIWGGLALVSINGPENGTLKFYGIFDEAAKFTIMNVPHVVLMDSRPAVIEAIGLAEQNGQFKYIYKHLNRPALVEIEKEDGVYTIFINPTDENIRVRDTRYKLDIVVNLSGQVPTQKFLFFQGGSQSRQTISYTALFRYT